jgi:hypothetical protein
MNIITKITYPALALFALACFALSPRAQAVVPPPDGGYPNDNTAEGTDALFSLTTGGNAAIGLDALYSNTVGSFNTATGVNTLSHNIAGGSNTASGANALFNNSRGDENTANGAFALYGNTTGSSNTANGSFALQSNTTGKMNTANGSGALYLNTTGIANTANGVLALYHNATGSRNTANGYNALLNSNAGGNTANGANALLSNTTGGFNTAIGFQALQNNTTGSFNTAVGFAAGINLTTGNDNIYVANNGVAADSGTLRIGNIRQTAAYIQGIYGQTVASGVGVIIDAFGHLGTVQSSAAFKEAIKPMDKASEAILALQPVTFRYKKEFDPEGIPQFGLVAEEVEKVNPDLVARDEEGKIMSVRYEAVNAMLLNEFLKEHQAVQELKKQIAELTAGLQRVSAQIELNKPTSQTALNNR